MSQRVQQKVMKYALVKFVSDNKTLQVKTNEIVSNTTLKVHAQVQVPWDGQRLKATILGLSDYQTDLNAVERNFMATLKKQNRPKNVLKKTVSQTKTSSLHRAKTLKRKEKRIEFVANTHGTSAPKRFREDHGMWEASLSRFTAAEITGVVEGNKSSSSSSNTISLTPISATPIPPFPLSPAPISLNPVVLINMDTHEITPVSESPVSSFLPILPPLSPPLSSPPVSPSPLSQLTTLLADDLATQDCIPDLSSHTVSDIYDRLDTIMNFMQRLEKKVDNLSTPVPTPAMSTVTTRCISTQTTEEVIEDDPHLEGMPDSVADHAETAPFRPELQTPEATVTESTQERFWKLTPSQLGEGYVTVDMLQNLIESVPRRTCVDDNQLDLPTDELEQLRKSSSSARHFAKNIMFHTFTMKELYKKNATGKNFTGINGERKTALNQWKFKKIVHIVGLRYQDLSLEKIVTTAINAALRYLWGSKLKHQPWMQL